MSVHSFLRASRDSRVIAQLSYGEPADLGVQPDVLGRVLQDGQVQVQAKTLAGQLFLSVLVAGG